MSDLFQGEARDIRSRIRGEIDGLACIAHCGVRRVAHYDGQRRASRRHLNALRRTGLHELRKNHLAVAGGDLHPARRARRQLQQIARSSAGCYRGYRRNWHRRRACDGGRTLQGQRRRTGMCGMRRRLRRGMRGRL